jgi:thiol:disulfide interchange protein
MQKSIGISALLILLIAACSSSSQDAATDKIDWVKDYKTGVTLAAQSGIPIMLYFTADWCPPCKELKKNVFSREDVALASRRLVNIYLDVDKDRATMEAYKVRSIPIIFFLDPTGEIVSTITGNRSAKEFLKHMKNLAENAKPAGKG